MTELETPEAEGRNDNVLVREFAAELSAGEGRTVDVRIVPYGERITHNDGQGGVARGTSYQEEWLPGVFSHQVNAANRVLVNVEHQEGIGGVVGHGQVLRESSDGFHGSFVLHDTAAGDTALALVKAGSLDGVSLEAIRVKDIRAGGVVQRAKANLRAIALTRFAAFAGARVLMVREEPEIFDEALLPVDMDPELVARCRTLGIKLPQRLQAHPAETDTPAPAGTSEDGTRQTQDKPTLEV